jgi:uncharacterized protein YcfJ
MKYLILITALAAAVPAKAEETKIRGTLVDHYTYVTENVPSTRRECSEVEVPVYGDRTRNGNAAEGALLGMVLGGVIGKGITGKDDGAAVGAVMGGIIGADQGAKPKTDRVITGYKRETQCTDVTYSEQVQKRVYDYSTIKFNVDGQYYAVDFVK